MDLTELEEYVSRQNIQIIPSEYWKLKYPDAYTVIKPVDLAEFDKKYASTIINKEKTFNITVLFQNELDYNTNDIVHLTRFIFTSAYAKKYKVIFKFNYIPREDLIRTFKIAGIEYIGPLEKREDYLSLLQNSHVVISSHRTNYSGLYLAEAALFGVPVITSPTGGSAQLFTQTNSLFLKTKNNDGGENFVPCHECLGGIFSFIDTSYPTLLRYGQRARLAARRMYSKERYKASLEAIKDSLES